MSMAGRCIAASTASGMFVGPGMLRNCRPLETVMALDSKPVEPPADARVSASSQPSCPREILSPGLSQCYVRLREDFPHCHPRAVQTRLHRGDRVAERGRGLLVR